MHGRMMRLPMLGNVYAPGKPDVGMALGILHEPPQSHDAPGAPNQAAMQPDRHHLGAACHAFGIKRIKAVFQIGIKLIARIEPLGRGKPHVIAIQRIGHDQLFTVPIRQIIGIAVGNIIKPDLGGQIKRVDRTAPGVPTARAFTGDFGVQANGLVHIGAFIFWRVILVVDPLKPVAGDLPLGGLHGTQLFRAARQCAGHAINRCWNVQLSEQTLHPPEPGTRTIFIDRFHVPVTLIWPGRGPNNFG